MALQLSVIICLLYCSHYAYTTKPSRRHNSSMLSKPSKIQFGQNYQLPKSIRPFSYQIKLKKLDTLTTNQVKLTGEVTIGLQVVQPTSAISFHLDLQLCKINDAKLHGSSLNAQFSGDYNNNVVTYQLFSQILPLTNYQFVLDYECLVNSYKTGNEAGLYFYNLASDRYWNSFDQPFNTRQWLPCWDEPEFKAKFSFLINSQLVRPGEVALANGQYLSTTGDGFLQFSSTPTMSTYLVSFNIGKFTSIQGRSNGGVSMTAWYPPNNNKTAQLARLYFNKAVKHLDWMTQYSGLRYDGAKLDVVFVKMPDDGMEQWGLITQDLDVDTTDTEAVEDMEYTACHEVAHQWFGNLITVSNWADIWLHEGFATLFSYRQSKNVDRSEWLANVKYYKKKSMGMENGKRTLVDNLYSTAEGWDFAYVKGCAILNMVESVMTDAAFQQALQIYLRRYQYGTVTTAQFLQVLDETARQFNVKGWSNGVLSLTEFLRSYLYTTGYPTIIIQPDLSSGTVSISQTSAQQWYVPISFRTPAESLKTYWLTPNTPNLTLGPAEGFQANTISQIQWDPDQTGYYVIRVSK